jgi:DNA-binding SARP family transcriptional activator/streptogramin lyase
VPLSFRILGPLEVREDGRELPLGTGRQRALLALLLVHANELVSSDRLIEELWSGRPPPSAQKALQGYVSQVRRALGADAILTKSSGYVLAATDTDAQEFERLTKLAADQDPDEAACTLEQALVLWRGRALEEFEYEEWAQLEIARLEELRLAATEQRIEAELQLGHHAQLVPELETLVTDHPLRERLRGQLMIALYRSGRQSDALDVYRRGRRVLHDELGLEPSPFLTELERQILGHDATLSAPARPLPRVGTVTFLFSDIEGSTRLLTQLGEERYREVLEQHQHILRDAVERCEGREVDSQGDSFFFVFASAKSALAAAVVAQCALAEHPWPDGGRVSVRMGLHSGEPSVGEELYVGLGVHRAARIGGVGHGGQVLLSNATRELVEDEVGGVTVRELGSYRLKGFDRPERLFQLEIEGLESEFPPLNAERFNEPRMLRRRSVLAAVVAVVVAVGIVVAIAVATLGGSTHEVLPNSLIRIDPASLKATEVAQVGDGPDLVVASGGYLWITNNILRDSASHVIRNRGDHTLTRVDPATGRVTPVGGVSPCGLTADPSGDVWVANCFVRGSGQGSNVVRVDARTLKFMQTLLIPGGNHYFRGLAYGDGVLWLADQPPYAHAITEVDPHHRHSRRTIRISYRPGALAWSMAYGDLWITNYDDGKLTRLDPATGATQTIGSVGINPGPGLAVDAQGTVWAGDWSRPHVVRTSAVGPFQPRSVPLRIRNRARCPNTSCVWSVAAGAGSIWATTPEVRALWRINPKTNAVRRISLPFAPTGVAADANNVWVTVRGKR